MKRAIDYTQTEEKYYKNLNNVERIALFLEGGMWVDAGALT